MSPDPATWQIPIDLTISKSYVGRTRGCIKATDALGHLVFAVEIPSSKADHRIHKILFDASNNPLISISRCDHGGEWQGYRGESCDRKDLIFRVVRTLHSQLRTELEVFLVGENYEEKTSDFRVNGSPFHRSCLIYKGNSILAQTSAMYKLGKTIIGRRKFRLTMYPGTDHALVVSLLGIFYGGK